ncbi:MAG: hypothetical protein V1685_07550 [Parcubacteria group bacterium]
MELTTFGDGLQFGMELESALLRVFEQMAKGALPSGQRELMQSFAQACKKRKTYLETLFKNNICSDMDTGVFQPIGCLDSSRYTVDWNDIQVAAVPGMLENMMIAEEKTGLFYNDFAAQIKSQRNAIALRFRKMAEEVAHQASKLKELKLV